MKKVCSRLLYDLKEMLGEEIASDVIYGFINASDKELREIRDTAEKILLPATATAVK